MAGPSIDVLLRQPLTDAQVDAMVEWLISSSDPLLISHPEPDPGIGLWIPAAEQFGLRYGAKETPCMLGVSLEDPRLVWGDEDREQIEAALGYVPEASISLYAGCNQLIDHSLLAHLALHLAEHFDGMLDFDGALTPPLKPGGHYTLANYPWQTLEEIHAFVQSLPGTLHEISYMTGRDELWVYHIGDVAFLRSWLDHPHFHLVK